MPRVQPKAMPNWCLQVKPDEPWTGRCGKEKIAADGKRHRCHKTEKRTDAVHACQCSLESGREHYAQRHIQVAGHSRRARESMI
jgi:hypothetical protein